MMEDDEEVISYRFLHVFKMISTRGEQGELGRKNCSHEVVVATPKTNAHYEAIFQTGQI